MSENAFISMWNREMRRPPSVGFAIFGAIFLLAQLAPYVWWTASNGDYWFAAIFSAIYLPGVAFCIWVAATAHKEA